MSQATTQIEPTTQTQPEAKIEPGVKAEINEGDLFGDEKHEESVEGPAEEDLFGEEDAPFDEVNAAPAAGAHDMDDLFGDADLGAAPEATDEPPLRAKVNLSVETLAQSDMPAHMMKMPNTISMDLTTFDPNTFQPSTALTYAEEVNEYGRIAVRLVAPENVVRHRFLGANGSFAGVAAESNARVVTWSDGSQTLQIGSEPFVLRQTEVRETQYVGALFTVEQGLVNKRHHIKPHDDRVHVGKPNEDLVLRQSGRIDTFLNATPFGLDSKSHERLKNAQARKLAPSSALQETNLHHLKLNTKNNIPVVTPSTAGQQALRDPTTVANQRREALVDEIRAVNDKRAVDGSVGRSLAGERPAKRGRVEEDMERGGIQAIKRTLGHRN